MCSSDLFDAEPNAGVLHRGEDFDVIDNHLALGGRQLHIRTSRADYADLFLALHGAHQGLNASAALVAVEEFFGTALDHEVVSEAFANVTMPGRFEVVGHQPLVILDGAHNAAGADVCAQVFFDDFDPVGRRILVVGAEEEKNIAGDEASRVQNAAAWQGREDISCRFMWPAAFGLMAGEYASRHGLDRRHLNRIAEINYDTSFGYQMQVVVQIVLWLALVIATFDIGRVRRRMLATRARAIVFRDEEVAS